jgi:hypothetical protein
VLKAASHYRLRYGMWTMSDSLYRVALNIKVTVRGPCIFFTIPPDAVPLIQMSSSVMPFHFMSNYHLITVEFATYCFL